MIRKKLERTSHIRCHHHAVFLFRAFRSACRARTEVEVNVLSTQYGVHKVGQQIIMFDHNIAVCLSRLNKLRPSIKMHVKADRKQHVSSLAASAQEAAARNDDKQLYRYVKELTPKKCQQIPGVILENGEYATSPLQARLRWQRFFADKVKASITSMSNVVDQCVSRQSNSVVGQSDMSPILVPARSHLRAAYVKLKRGTGHGEDAIPNEAFIAAPDEMAALFHPIWMKATLRLQHPVLWKGGMLSELWKGKGSAANCDNSRGIVVSDSSGKSFHS